VPEQLALDERRGNRRAIDRFKPLSPADRMDGSRQGALAGSGLTHDEHGLVAGSVLDGDL